jgi:hypothetical protein
MSTEEWAKARAQAIVNRWDWTTQREDRVREIAAALCEVAGERDRLRAACNKYSEDELLQGDLRAQLAVRERELADSREQMQRVCDGGDVFFLEQWLAAHPELPK